MKTLHSRSPRRRWLAAWFGLAVLAVANGTTRETLYPESLGDAAAHQLSTFTLLALIAGYVWLLQRRWPLLSDTDALRVGAAWVTMTLVFEFGFGHYVDGASWSSLLAEYDLAAGNLWVLVPLATALAPVVVRRLQQRGQPTGPTSGPVTSSVTRSCAPSGRASS